MGLNGCGPQRDWRNLQLHTNAQLMHSISSSLPLPLAVPAHKLSPFLCHILSIHAHPCLHYQFMGFLRAETGLHSFLHVYSLYQSLKYQGCALNHLTMDKISVYS